MPLIFDLDDTLYDESQYVDSGLSAVASFGAERWGWDAQRSLSRLREILAQEGRGKVFDRWLEVNGAWSKRRVAECVTVYRHHRPVLSLLPSARRILNRYGSRVSLYLVTDGHKVVQRNKVDALNLWPEFRRIFITHRFGLIAAKPSLYCFERIRDSEGCDWVDMVYVGDNPAKDFVALTQLGAQTVRVLTGAHAGVTARRGHDADVTIPSLDALPEVLLERFPAWA